ncbi:sulfur carrier protein ThiS [Planosporangium sp. 12N6]|uniref:sulfur carrier protein ThiS n=1 Tax=Planosporangium spinosum TaxID=3402278 RepID=UPI003CEE9B0A
MDLTVNGEHRTLSGPTSVADLVSELTNRETGVAVAVNGEVVPRSVWAATALGRGDAVEILTAVQGG